ncbi:hypothetical protein H4R19_003744 [Coemansia spiralis]|nr:hypothetical protein H4R19_003744 [Coemansia spiralis]
MGPRSPGAGSRTSDYRLPPPASMAAMEPPRPMASNLPVSAQPSRAASTEVSPRPDTPQAVPTAVAVERAPQGQLPAVAPVWEGDHAAAPEGHLLNASEAVALSIRQLAAGTSVQIQARAHSMLGMAAWLPAATRSTLALSDLAIEEPFARVPAVLPVPDQQAADTDAASRGRSYSTADSADSAASEDPATPPLKAISVALPAGAAKDSRAVVLRHANPLLCSWSALALCLFARWHVANDATPDFSSTEWQTLRLFPDIAAGPEPAENDFARLFAAATAEITNDK